MYEPNIKDPRVLKRIQRALDWTINNLGKTPKAKSKREIDDHLGRGELAYWLRDQLLICIDHYYNMETGKCKRYIRNTDGVKSITGLLRGSVTISQTQQTQLDTGVFEYKEQSSRLWNPLQNLPRYIKRPALAKNGYNYNYDIQCCAPRLLLQYARRCGLDSPTPLLDQYISNRTEIRSELSTQLGISTDQVKRLINALLNGSVISHREDTSVFLLVGSKHTIIDQLKTNQYVCELREEIKSLWRSIKPHRPVRTITDVRGRTRTSPLSSRDKAEIYRELELDVIKSVQTYLVKTNNRGLLEHDGWSCSLAIDIDELRTYVRSHTGYMIELDWEIWQ
jgi:hypothetical protein